MALAHIFKLGSTETLCDSKVFNERRQRWDHYWHIKRYETRPCDDDSRLCPHCLDSYDYRWSRRAKKARG